MARKDDNILFFRPRPEKAKENLKNFCKTVETQAINLNIILSDCIEKNNFNLLYQYFLSEIEFRGGINVICEKIKMNPNKVRQTLRSQKEPGITFLSKMLEMLELKLNVSAI